MHEGFWEECCCNEARQIEEDAQFDAGDHEARLATPTSIEEAFETHIGFRVGNQVEERMPRFADAVRRRFEQAVWQALREHCADSFEVARAILGGAGHCGMGARFREADLIAFARTVARRVIARPEPMRELLFYC